MVNLCKYYFISIILKKVLPYKNQTPTVPTIKSIVSKGDRCIVSEYHKTVGILSQS